MLRIQRERKFSKDVERAKRRKADMNKLKSVIKHLAKQNPLPARYKVHALKGKFFGCRECHIEKVMSDGGDLIEMNKDLLLSNIGLVN